MIPGRHEQIDLPKELGDSRRLGVGGNGAEASEDADNIAVDQGSHFTKGDGRHRTSRKRD